MQRANPRLDSKLHRAFRELANAGFKQYEISKADLARQAKRKVSKSDLLYERAGVQTRGAGDALVGKTPTQVRRFVENVLSRPSSAESARIVIWRIVNCEKACAWRKASTGSDPWLTKVLELQRADAPYIHKRSVASDEGPVYAFIHPKGVPEFVRQTLDDVESWLPSRTRTSLEKAMIRSIGLRAKDRARALAHWVAQSEAFVDVRVYEGPMYDAATDATVETHQIRYRRVKLFEDRAPLESRERSPKAAERVEAIMSDALDDLGEPTRIVQFIVGPFQAIAVEGNEIFVE